MDPNIPLRYQIPLQKRKILKQNLRGIVSALLIWAGITLIAMLLIRAQVIPIEEETFMFLTFRWVAILGLLLFWKLAYPILYFITYFYDIEGDNIVIRKGIIAKSEITLPFSRITDVYIDQDVLDVAFGLCDLHLSTPTAESGKFAHIDGLSKRGAAELRELVLQRINITKGVAGNAVN